MSPSSEESESELHRFEVETEVSLTGSVEVEAESWKGAVRMVKQMDPAEVEDRLTTRNRETAGVYRVD